jgi:hypothetical protein
LDPTAVLSSFAVANRLAPALFKPQTAQPKASRYIFYTTPAPFIYYEMKRITKKRYSIRVFPNSFSLIGFIFFTEQAVRSDK